MRYSTGLAVVALLIAAAPLSAQAAASNDSSATVRDSAAVATSVTPRTSPAPRAGAPALGAPMTGLRTGVHLAETARPLSPNAAATNPHLGQARALMVVGGAALLTGAIIGGDTGTIFMVGGALIGLYGLYQYLQ
jgi:hypothetical protein